LQFQTEFPEYRHVKPDRRDGHGKVEIIPLLGASRGRHVLSLARGTDFYAAGYSRNSSNVMVPGYWKNGAWNGLTPLDAGIDSYVYSMVLNRGDVYVGGRSNNSSNVMVPGYWENGTWVSLAPLDSARDSHVHSLVVQ
jgi:hypothetical protein